MPNPIKVLILSDAPLQDTEETKLIAQIQSNSDINNPPITRVKIVSALEEAEATINSENYDIVICTKDLKIAPWTLVERIPSEKRPIFVIDGAIDNIIQREFELSPFSGAATIIKKDPANYSTIFEFGGAYNAANGATPNTTSTHFNIGSITKMMTSIAFAKFMEEAGGHFALDTPLYQSLIEVKSSGKVVDPFYLKVFSTIPDTTPRQLLSHTSGLRDHLGTIFESDLGPDIIGFESVRDYTEHFHDFNTSFALFNFTPDEIRQLQTVAGKDFQKIRNIDLNNEEYKKITFTHDEIDQIKSHLEETHQNSLDAQKINEKLVFDPTLPLENIGDHVYCNFGYQLLGLAIESVKGDYYDYLQENVLDVAGMIDTTPLRKPGADFAVPSIDTGPFSIPDFPLIQNTQHEEITKLKQTAHEILTEAQQLAEKIHLLKPLIEKYQQALLTCPPDQFDEFKNKYRQEIDPIFKPILNLIKKIEAVGLPLHNQVGKIQETNQNDGRLADLQQLDSFFYQLHASLMPSAIESILNSLSKASPDGRNMYSTVDDMLQFQEAITTGALSEYKQHLTTQAIPSPQDLNPPLHGRSCRYGLGCAVVGDENDPHYTLAHGGAAPGMKAAFQTYPNQGYTIITLANNDVSQRHLADMAEKNLVFGAEKSVFYIDPRVTPNISQSIQKSLTDRKSQETNTSEKTRMMRENMEKMKQSDPNYTASTTQIEQEQESNKVPTPYSSGGY